jgi:Icc-related predicted phosphoesterase
VSSLAADPPQQDLQASKECAAPLDPAPSRDVQIGGRAATLAGYHLTFKDKGSGSTTFGVLGPINEDSGRNLLTLRKYLRFFQDNKADAVLVTGDVGEVAEGIARVLKVLGASRLPVLVVIGNRECRADFNDGVALAQKEFSNIINLNQIREVDFPAATIVSLPGYHDPNYINCATGCRYYKSTVDEVVQLGKTAPHPAVLVTHGPPRGEGSQALDYAISGGNAGDQEITRALREGNISFGVFSNIKEAGARATDLAGTTLYPEKTFQKSLYLNPGPADTMGWEMNDGTKSYGMAALLTVRGHEASWRLYRAKPLSKEEREQANALEPGRSESGASLHKPTTPSHSPAASPKRPKDASPTSR